MAKITAKPDGRYYDLEPLVYQGKPFAVRIHGKSRPFSKTFLLHDMGGIYQYSLSQCQMEWLRHLQEQI